MSTIQGVKGTIHSIALAVAEATEPTKPSVWFHEVAAGQIVSELGGLSIVVREGPLDNFYYCPYRSGLADMLAYLYFDFHWPPYLIERMDCDDFAFLMKALASALFGCNAFGAVRGNQGRHYWNLVRCADGSWVQLEPQNGALMELLNPLYVSEVVII